MTEVPHAEVVASPRTPDRRRWAGFEDFYAAELPRLVALARGLCGPAAAEDVAQEAMLVAYRRWGTVGDLERPEQWVRRTCANLAVSTFRRRVVELRSLTRLSARRPEAPEPISPISPESEEFWAAVRRLPTRQAQAAALRYLYDLPLAEIAATLDCTEGTVKQHLSRARAALAAILGLADDHREEQS